MSVAWKSTTDLTSSDSSIEHMYPEDYQVNDQTAFMLELAEIANVAFNQDELDNFSYIQNHTTMWATRLQRLREDYDNGNYIQDAKSHELVIQATLAEKNTWVLLESLTKVDMFLSNASQEMSENTPSFLERFHWDDLHTRLLRSNPELMRLYAIVDWLEMTYEPVSISCSSLLYSASMRRALSLRASNPSKLTSLDPDSLYRPAARDLLDDHDVSDEHTLMRAVFHLIRAGDTDAAADLCRTNQQSWRVASLLGDANYSLLTPAEAAARGVASGSVGNARVLLWSSACHNLAQASAATSPYEAAVYGVLAGDAEPALNVCMSWSDQCWALMRAEFNRADRALLTAHVAAEFREGPADQDGNTDVMDALMGEGDATTELGRSVRELRAVSVLSGHCVSAKDAPLPSSPEVDLSEIISRLRATFPLTHLFSSSAALSLSVVVAEWAQAAQELLVLGETRILAQEMAKQAAFLLTVLAPTHASAQTRGSHPLLTVSPAARVLLQSFLAFATHLSLYFALYSGNPINPMAAPLGDHASYLTAQYISTLALVPALHPAIPAYAQLLPTPVLTEAFTAFLRGLASPANVQAALRHAQRYPRLAAEHVNIARRVLHSTITDEVAPAEEEMLGMDMNVSSAGGLWGDDGIFTPQTTRSRAARAPRSSAKRGRVGVMEEEEEEEESLAWHTTPAAGARDASAQDRDEGADVSFSFFGPTPSKAANANAERRRFFATPHKAGAGAATADVGAGAGAAEEEGPEMSSFLANTRALDVWTAALCGATERQDGGDLALFLPSSLSVFSLPEEQIASALPPAHRTKVDSLSLMYVDSEPGAATIAVTSDPARITEAALFANALMRAFTLAQSPLSARALALASRPLAAAVEADFAEEMEVLATASPAHAQQRAQALLESGAVVLPDDVAASAMEADGTLSPAALSIAMAAMELRGNAAREMRAWQAYLCALQWTHAFAEVLKSRPVAEPSAIVDDNDWVFTPSASLAQAASRHAAALALWRSHLQETALSTLTAIRESLSLPGGFLFDVSLPGSAAEYPVERENELRSLRETVVPQLCLLTVWISKSLVLHGAKSAESVDDAEKVVSPVEHAVSIAHTLAVFLAREPQVRSCLRPEMERVLLDAIAEVEMLAGCMLT